MCRISGVAVCVPVTMTLKYQNSPITMIGVNPSIEQLQGQTLRKTNQNEAANPVGVSDADVTPVLVANLRPASDDDVESAISEDNCETTITEHSLYSSGASVFTNDELQYDVPMRNVERIFESARGERSSLGGVSVITDAMAIVKNEPV